MTTKTMTTTTGMTGRRGARECARVCERVRERARICLRTVSHVGTWSFFCLEPPIAPPGSAKLIWGLSNFGMRQLASVARRCEQGCDRMRRLVLATIGSYAFQQLGLRGREPGRGIWTEFRRIPFAAARSPATFEFAFAHLYERGCDPMWRLVLAIGPWPFQKVDPLGRTPGRGARSRCQRIRFAQVRTSVACQSCYVIA